MRNYWWQVLMLFIPKRYDYNFAMSQVFAWFVGDMLHIHLDCHCKRINMKQLGQATWAQSSWFWCVTGSIASKNHMCLFYWVIYKFGMSIDQRNHGIVGEEVWRCMDVNFKNIFWFFSEDKCQLAELQQTVGFLKFTCFVW